MKIAIVTGASSGIGRETALELGRRGIGVILTWHSSRQGADDAVRSIEKSGGAGAASLKLDLRDHASLGEFASRVRDTLATVWQRAGFDYLVNNGGVAGEMLFPAVSEEFFDRIVDTNFKGPYFLTQHLLVSLSEGGSIVNVSSTSGNRPFPGYSAYGASKAALASWTRYLARELAPRRIRVNAVSPVPPARICRTAPSRSTPRSRTCWRLRSRSAEWGSRRTWRE